MGGVQANEDFTLPVLDISEFAQDETSTAADDFVRELREACHSIGFIYLYGHGIAPQLNERLLTIARNCPPSGVPQTLGGTAAGADPEITSAVLEWRCELDRLAHTLLRAVARAICQDPAALEHGLGPFDAGTVDLVHYAPRGPDEDDIPRVGIHRDVDLLTFILQDDVGGLEVERNGELIEVIPLTGALVVNLGEMLEALTDGFFKATVHRVVSPPLGVEQCSCIYLFSPRLDVTTCRPQLPRHSELAELRPRPSDLHHRRQ